MLVADVIMWFLVTVGVLLAFPALWLLCLGLFPNHVEAAADYMDRHRVKPFFVGLPIAVVAFIAVASLGGKMHPVFDVASLLVLGGFLLYSNIGTAGLATLLGRKLPSPVDRERPWKGTLRGGTVLVLSFVFPVLGWFCIMPISLIAGAGAITLRLLGQRKSRRDTRGADPLSDAKLGSEHKAASDPKVAVNDFRAQ